MDTQESTRSRVGPDYVFETPTYWPVTQGDTHWGPVPGPVSPGGVHASLLAWQLTPFTQIIPRWPRTLSRSLGRTQWWSGRLNPVHCVEEDRSQRSLHFTFLLRHKELQQCSQFTPLNNVMDQALLVSLQVKKTPFSTGNSNLTLTCSFSVPPPANSVHSLVPVLPSPVSDVLWLSLWQTNLYFGPRPFIPTPLRSTPLRTYSVLCRP